MKLLEDRLGRAQAEVEEAQEAAQIVADTEAAYRAYERAQAELTGLEEARQERDRLVSERHGIETDVRLCEQDRQRTDDDWKAVQQAEAELERLAPLVEQQRRLEQEISQARQDQEAFQQLEQAIAQYGAVSADLTRRREQAEARLSRNGVVAAREARTVQPAASLEAQASVARDQVAQVEAACDWLEDASSDLQSVHQQVEAIREQLEARRQWQEQLEAVIQEANAAAGLLRDAQFRLDQITHEQQTLESYQALLSVAGARCPVCQRPMDEHARADTEAHFAAERERLRLAYQAAQQEFQAAQAEADRLTAARASIDAQIAALPGEASLGPLQARWEDAAAALDRRRAEAARLYESALEACDVLVATLAEHERRAQALAASGQSLPNWQSQLEALGNPQHEFERAQERANERSLVEARRAEQQARWEGLQNRLERVEAELAEYADLNERLAEAQRIRDENKDDHQLYLVKMGVASELDSRQEALAALQEELEARQAAQWQAQQERDALAETYDADAHRARRAELRELDMRRVEVQTRLSEHEEALQARQQKLAELEQAGRQLAQQEREHERLLARHQAFEFVRNSIRQAGPKITQQLVRLIAERANRIFADIIGDPGFVLNWSDDYAVSVTYRGEQRDFQLLSGGEQMAAAIAVRLALLTQLANVQFAFFDEPTANLDEARRSQLAESLGEIRSLRQLFVISHDDTFEQESYHVIQVRKEDGLSQVETL